MLKLPARHRGFAGGAVTSRQGVVAAAVKHVRRAGGPGRGSRHRFRSKVNSVFDARCFARRAAGLLNVSGSSTAMALSTHSCRVSDSRYMLSVSTSTVSLTAEASAAYGSAGIISARWAGVMRTEVV